VDIGKLVVIMILQCYLLYEKAYDDVCHVEKTMTILTGRQILAGYID
jgi:hypothetical protein